MEDQTKIKELQFEGWLKKDKSKMRKIQKEIKAILELTVSVDFKESRFQELPLYQKFKAKNYGHKSEIMDLILGLYKCEFYNECIFWCLKLFNERVCGKYEKSLCYSNLCKSYTEIQDYEKAIEFGRKYFTVEIKVDTKEKLKVLEALQCCYGELGRSNEFTLEEIREILKIKILLFNKNLIDQMSLLLSYIDLIAFYIEKSRDFEDARKILKSLKLFNLNSKNPNDVIDSMKSSDMRPFLQSYLNVQSSSVNEKSISKIEYNVKIHGLVFLISRILYFKSLTYHYLGDEESCKRWGHLYFSIMSDMLANTTSFESQQSEG